MAIKVGKVKVGEVKITKTPEEIYLEAIGKTPKAQSEQDMKPVQDEPKTIQDEKPVQGEPKSVQGEGGQSSTITKRPCSYCGGSGQVEGYNLNCEKCGGEGCLDCMKKVPCVACKGEGEIVEVQEPTKPVEKGWEESFNCSECDMTYETKKEAKECCDGKAVNKFLCSDCGNEYDRIEDAQACYEDHLKEEKKAAENAFESDVRSSGYSSEAGLGGGGMSFIGAMISVVVAGVVMIQFALPIMSEVQTQLNSTGTASETVSTIVSVMLAIIPIIFITQMLRRF